MCAIYNCFYSAYKRDYDMSGHDSTFNTRISHCLYMYTYTRILAVYVNVHYDIIILLTATAA